MNTYNFNYDIYFDKVSIFKLFKNYFKKFISIFIVAILVISQCSLIVKADVTEFDNWLAFLNSQFWTTIGLASGITHGNVTGSDINNSLELLWRLGVAVENGQSYEDFINSKYHTDNVNNTVTIDADLYNLIQEYIERLKSNPYSGVREANTRSLELKPLEGDSSATTGIDMVDQFFKDCDSIRVGFSGNFYWKSYFETWDRISNNSNYMQNADVINDMTNNDIVYDTVWKAYPAFSNIGENGSMRVSTSFNNRGDFPFGYKCFVYPRGTKVYYVMDVNNDGDYSFSVNTYDAENDELVPVTECYFFKSNFCVQKDKNGPRIWYDNAGAVRNRGTNYCFMSDDGFQPGQSYGINQNNARLQEAYEYENRTAILDKADDTGSKIIAPYLRSIEGTSIDVFSSPNDVLDYIHNAGGYTYQQIDNSKHIKNVVINNDNKSVSYGYYTEQEWNQVEYNNYEQTIIEGEEIDFSDMDEALTKILKQLRQIKNAINNIDFNGSGSGTNSTDLTELMTELRAIKAALQNQQIIVNSPDVYVTVSGNSSGGGSDNWTYEDIQALNNHIDSLIQDLDDLCVLTSNIHYYLDSNQKNILTNMYVSLLNIENKLSSKGTIRDTNDNLDWLIRQIENLIGENMSIPENIMQMLGLKFPFSLPYILVIMLNKLEAVPQAPVLTMELNWLVDQNDFFGDNVFVLDLSEYEEVAKAFKLFVTLNWIMLLLKLTPKMLRNGSEIIDNKVGDDE